VNYFHLYSLLEDSLEELGSASLVVLLW